jgi:hypothetical protein
MSALLVFLRGGDYDAGNECGEQVFVEKEGVLFRLEPEEPPQKPDIWADYDPEKAREGLRKSAGALAGVDRDTPQRDIQNQRKQDSHGRPA